MPDSYVVQIYRRDPARRRMTGTVERVGNGGRVGFASADELWRFLAAERTAARRAARAARKSPARSPHGDAASTQPKEKKP
jgi:hypothetical protein